MSSRVSKIGINRKKIEMVDALHQPTSSPNWAFRSRVLGFLRKLAKGSTNFRFFQSLRGLTRTGSMISFLLALALAYLFVYRSLQSVVPIQEIPKSSDPIKTCNFFAGKWIPDEMYPLYNASECPFAERGFNCIANGRRDRGYMKWKWKPKDCEIPRFDAVEILKRLRGKRIVFVGDSLSRTQWESMICLLMVGVEDKRSVYEVNHNRITKQSRHLSVRFNSVNLTIEFYRSVFLVQPGSAPQRAPKRVKSTVMLDKLDEISQEWIDSDVLVFNSGHWWTSTKLFDMGCYFQTNGSLKLGMTINSAYKLALRTWATWVESRINPNRTDVFFRTFEPSHWSGPKRKSCKLTRKPSQKTRGKDRSKISDMIQEVAKNMSVPVTVLHVTPMGAYRSDAHVGKWSGNPAVPDCSHWCLPGVPDTWNQILLSYLLLKENRIS